MKIWWLYLNRSSQKPRGGGGGAAPLPQGCSGTPNRRRHSCFHSASLVARRLQQGTQHCFIEM